jgi:cobalamin synthase
MQFVARGVRHLFFAFAFFMRWPLAASRLGLGDGAVRASLGHWPLVGFVVGWLCAFVGLVTEQWLPHLVQKHGVVAALVMGWCWCWCC